MTTNSETSGELLAPGALWPRADWLDDSDFTVEVLLTKAPGGDRTLVFDAEGGRLRTVESLPAGADVKIEVPWKDAALLASGEVAPAVAYMRGALKPSGDMALVLRLLKSTSSSGFETWRRAAVA